MLGDSIYNGARDNAIGVVALLNAIKYFEKYPTRRSLIFLATSAEEAGLFGSIFFTRNLPAPLQAIRFNFNSDGIGYNDKNSVTVLGLSNSIVRQEIVRGCQKFSLRVTESEDPEGFYRTSDNYSFARIGIPAITFSPGVSGLDQEIRKFYHQPQDDIQHLDFEYIQTF